MEPPPADVHELERERAYALEEAPKRGGIVGLALLFSVYPSTATEVGLSEVVYVGICLTVAVGLGIYWFEPIFTIKQKIDEARRAAKHDRAKRWDQHCVELERWRGRIEAHDEAERQRIRNTNVWHPLKPQSAPSRVDVFGGSSDGWASLVATFGSAMLTAGARILMLDFSDDNVAGGLAKLANSQGVSVQRYGLPTGLGRLDLLRGLDPDEIAELLAVALNVGRSAADSEDLRALGADLVRAVAAHLDGPATFARLASGLQVLQRVYDDRDAGPLSVEEQIRITAHVHTIGQSERVQNEIRHIRSAFDLLAREATEGNQREGLGTCAALTVLTTASSNERQKTLTNNVVFQSTLHHVRMGTPDMSPDVLIVAGADRLGVDHVESLARHAHRRRMRLIYMVEHLRGDMTQLLGGSDSAAVLMRVGNAQEAAKAAEHIGQEHKFVLSQITEGVGRTFTTGRGETTGTTDTLAETEGVSSGVSYGQGGRSTNQGRTSSVTKSRAKSWQETRNWSEANATNEGTTQARVHEFAVEPTALQSLPPTAFILVDTGPAGRRIALGDCNPGIVGLNRVAQEPREITSPRRPFEDNEGTQSPPPEQPTESPADDDAAHSLIFADPWHEGSAGAERVRRNGYNVRYERINPEHPVGGWRVERRDGIRIGRDERDVIAQQYLNGRAATDRM